MDRFTYSQRNIEKIIEFKLMLKGIIESKISIKPKISQLQSLKYIISLSISKLIQQRNQELNQKEHSRLKMKTSCKMPGAISQSEFSQIHPSKIWNESQYCKMMLYNISRMYDAKDRINAKLYELQCVNDKINMKFQKYSRQNMRKGQRDMLLNSSKINTELVRLRTSLINLKSQTVSQHDNLVDVVNVLKVKYNILKGKIRVKQKTKQSECYELKYQKRQIMSSINEQNNQFMINL